MKYKKGTFIVIPNIEFLSGKPSEMQSIFLWICKHSDDDGICYPTRNTIAKESGCNVKTVDKYIKQLEDDGFIIKTTRNKPNSKEKTSNIYQVVILDEVAPKTVVPSTENGVTPSTENGAETKPIINSTHLTESLPEGKITLPVIRGKSPTTRLLSIYNTLFWSKYKVEYKGGKNIIELAVFKRLLDSYTEIQLAMMLISYFEWQGVSGDEFREQEYLSKQAFPVTLFQKYVTKIEIYLKNVISLPIDNDEKLLPIIGEHITKIEKSRMLGINE